MSEALLQRAKAAGRNRVAVQPESPADAALAAMRRLMRVTEAVRAAVAGVLGASEPPGPEKPLPEPAAPFPEGFTTRAKVVAGLGYDPARERGSLLSSPEKASSYVARVTPAGRPGVVVKIAPEETVVNEMAMRGVLESFDDFSGSLRAPRTGAYRRWFLKPVMVMEDIRRQGSRMTAADLPMGQKAALALFALTFGVHDLNPGAFLRVGWRRTVVTDFERARSETRAAAPNRIGAFSETLWVSTSYLNDEADYRPALTRWRETFAKPQSQEKLAGILRSAGVPEARIARDLEVFRGNLERLPRVLAADITLANRSFRESCARAGLTTRQTRALSDLNRAAHRSPADGAARDTLRWLLGRDPMRAEFSVHPEEIAALARRKQPFSASARERLLQAAGNGGLFSFDGRPIEPAAAAAAFDALKRLLGS
jgi:hypothetical protein